MFTITRRWSTGPGKLGLVYKHQQGALNALQCLDANSVYNEARNVYMYCKRRPKTFLCCKMGEFYTMCNVLWSHSVYLSRISVTHSITALQCHSVTMSQCHSVIPGTAAFFRMSPEPISPRFAFTGTIAINCVKTVLHPLVFISWTSCTKLQHLILRIVPIFCLNQEQW